MGTPNPGQYQPYQQSYPPSQPPPPQQYAPQGHQGYQGGYQQGGYGAPSGYAPVPAEAPGTYMGHPLASWIYRVGSSLIDGLIAGAPVFVIQLVVMVALSTTDPFTGARIPTTAGSLLNLLGWLVYLGLWVYNSVYLQGTSGQSWGKRIVGTRLVRMSDGQPLGAGMAFVRGIAHLVDILPFPPIMIGLLFPLWDARRQTFADKICSSLVLADQGRR